MAIKLLHLRINFTENTRPIALDSALDKSVLNQFRVPFRITPSQRGRDGPVILIRGDLNSNGETGEWHGMHGFVARLLQAKVAGAREAGLKK